MRDGPDVTSGAMLIADAKTVMALLLTNWYCFALCNLCRWSLITVQQLRTRVAVLETEVRDKHQLLQRQEQLQQAAQQSKVCTSWTTCDSPSAFSWCTERIGTERRNLLTTECVAPRYLLTFCWWVGVC